MRIDHGVKKRARIEMIPLIDSMFLLLVFFIYSMLSMTIHRGIQVNLPEAETGKIDKRDYVAISINHEGKIFLEKQEISLPELRLQLENVRESHADWPVFISADRTVPYELIIVALDAVRSAGLTRVSLETRERTNDS
jgi:biopolymer transport protein ExbD